MFNMPFPVYNSRPTVGEMFTVTCFACGHPSSKEWAQKVWCRPYRQEPYFPFLLDEHPAPQGGHVMEDGTVNLCAFCHALLESQWNAHEARRILLPQRKYNVHKFICAVCGVETYRKRVRALPFQEFPFLVKGRQTGSITLGNNPLAVVCLDCSETLWAQSAEYDRWGLPVHKRHFNWMARPPPPENSVDSAVARLPSGETQLPRCPPNDPLVPPKTNEPTALPETIPPVRSSRQRSASVNQRSDVIRYNYQEHGARKASVGYHPLYLEAHPPVVTVAPMSLHYAKPIQSSNKTTTTCSSNNIEPVTYSQISYERRRNENRHLMDPKLQLPYQLANTHANVYEDKGHESDTHSHYVSTNPTLISETESYPTPWMSFSRYPKSYLTSPAEKRSTLELPFPIYPPPQQALQQSRMQNSQSSHYMRSPLHSPIIQRISSTSTYPTKYTEENVSTLFTQKSNVDNTPRTDVNYVDSTETQNNEILLKHHNTNIKFSNTRRDIILPKKRHWEPTEESKSHTDPTFNNVILKKRQNVEPSHLSQHSEGSIQPENLECSARTSPFAIDLSISPSRSRSLNMHSKFSIAYLSQSESQETSSSYCVGSSRVAKKPDADMFQDTIHAEGTLSKEELISNVKFLRSNLVEPIADTTCLRDSQQQQQQRCFLSQLGLIRQQEKILFELESIASRSEHGTIPPLKLRVKSPPLPPQPVKLVSRIEESFYVYQDPAKTEFLKMLGLSPSRSSTNSLCINYPSYTSSTRKTIKFVDDGSSTQVLRIPVMKKRCHKTSWLSSSSSSDSEINDKSDETNEQLDTLLITSAEQWELTKRALAKILKDMKSVAEPELNIEETCRSVRRIIKYLKSQQLDLRNTQRTFKMFEQKLYLHNQHPKDGQLTISDNL